MLNLKNASWLPSKDEILRTAVSTKVIAGIYFLIRDGEVVYVGSSADVGCRIAEHKGEGKKEFDSASIIRLDDSNMSLMKDIEAFYVLTLKPEYNGCPPGNESFKSILHLKNSYGIPKWSIKRYIKSGQLPVFVDYHGIYYFTREDADAIAAFHFGEDAA